MDRNELMTLVAGKRRSLLMAVDDDEVYDKKPQRYAEDNRAAFNRTHWWIWSRSNKKRLCSRYYTVKADGQKALHGLSATAELLVFVFAISNIDCLVYVLLCAKRR